MKTVLATLVYSGIVSAGIDYCDLLCSSYKDWCNGYSYHKPSGESMICHGLHWVDESHKKFCLHDAINLACPTKRPVFELEAKEFLEREKGGGGAAAVADDDDKHHPALKGSKTTAGPTVKVLGKTKPEETELKGGQPQADDSGSEYQVELYGDAPVFSAMVQMTGSSNKQSIELDTAGFDAWIITNEYCKAVLGSDNQDGIDASLCESICSGNSELRYADGSIVKCPRWSQSKFSIGDHSWRQRFGIADCFTWLEEREKWGKPMRGIIGMNLQSEFVEENPIFSFRPTDRSGNNVVMKFGKFDETKVCGNGQMVYAPVVETGPYGYGHWYIETTVMFGKTVMSEEKIIATVDTGTNYVFLPAKLFNKMAATFRIASHILGPCEDLDSNLLPKFTIVVESVLVTVSLWRTVERDVRSFCVFQAVKTDGKMVIGASFLRHIVAEFDAGNMRIGMCLP